MNFKALKYLAAASTATWIWSGLTVVALGFIGYGWKEHTDLTNEHIALQTKTQELEQTLTTTQKDLGYEKSVTTDLTEKLRDKEAELNTVQRAVNRITKKVDTIEKLNSIDKELLEKYSKVYFLNEHYIPKRLEDIDTEYLLHKDKPMQVNAGIWTYLEDMLKDAKEDGVTILIASAYRSFDTQTTLKSTYKVIYGAGTANQFSADQGYSEHQLGTALDFADPIEASLTINFEQTKAFEWLKANAYKYGFILSYPKGNAYYQYEPWHWRFVGRDLARKMFREKLNFYDLEQREINTFLVDFYD